MKNVLNKSKDLIELFPSSLQDGLKGWQNVSYIVLSVFALDMKKMGILVLLLILDTFFGMVKSVTLKGFKSLSISTFIIGMMKKTLFIAIPFVLSIIAQGVAVDDVAKIEVWLSIVIITLILQQGYSVIANIASVLTQKDVRSKDFVSVMLEKIMQIIELLANKFIDKLKNILGNEK